MYGNILLNTQSICYYLYVDEFTYVYLLTLTDGGPLK